MSRPFTIVVTGAGGQLGKEIAEWQTNPSFLQIVGLSRANLDVTDLDQCRSAMVQYLPDAVIHCAAYTAVDKAESEPDEAFRVNAAGTRNIALAAREHEAKLAYISTDYVFDGQGVKPYNEYDRTNPMTVYGKSKLAGEELIKTLHDKYFIVRTSWVYGQHGSNFVKTMLKLGEEKKSLQVVHDQMGCPTYTYDLAEMLLNLIHTDYYGIYHASNTGECSWFEFAKAIFEEASMHVDVNPCTTADFPRPAPRPAYSVLDHSSLRANGIGVLRPWNEALASFMSTMKE